MSIIYVLIPIAILLTALGLYLFFWAVKTEQFDDLEKQGLSILFEDDDKDEDTVTSKPKSQETARSSTDDDHSQPTDKS